MGRGVHVECGFFSGKREKKVNRRKPNAVSEEKREKEETFLSFESKREGEKTKMDEASLSFSSLPASWNFIWWPLSPLSLWPSLEFCRQFNRHSTLPLIYYPYRKKSSDFIFRERLWLFAALLWFHFICVWGREYEKWRRKDRTQR